LAESAFKSAKGTWQASVFEKRLVTLRTLRAEYNARRLDGALRYAPFSIYIFGPSGVGKSTLAGLAMSDCLKASGANPDPKFTAVLKESDNLILL
jgi:DNA replication protein DnaC